MKKTSLILILLLTTFHALAQESNTYKGVVVNKDKTPIEVFSVVVFNAKDSTKQLYANTFSNGNFAIDFTPKKDEKYGVYLLAMGYSDTRIPLEQMRDTVTLRNSSMKIDDVIVQGKRDVSSKMTIQGGIVYDVSRTYLSKLGTSTMLLNFIPGVQAYNNGEISVVGATGNTVIYVNDVMLNDNNKLLSLKSEDIKSVEILRSPGAKYKNADAVVLIRTINRYIGFSSRVTAMSYVSSDSEYSLSPQVDLAYNKDKINISGSYHFNKGLTKTSNYYIRKIDNKIIDGDWELIDESSTTNNNKTHWYTANLDYNIDKKNYLNIQYSGNYSPSTLESSDLQDINSNTNNIFKNKINSTSSSNNKKNAVHLFYNGKYSDVLNVSINVDFSQRSFNSDILNKWIENTNLIEFGQKTQSDALAITAEVLFESVIKQKHRLNYGVEYTHLKDMVTSNDIENNNTVYELKSNFIKTILEFETTLFKKISFKLGSNYMYSHTNNIIDKGINYNSIIPYITLQHYNQKKQYGWAFNIKYYSKQPDAGLLDNVTIKYISPYEIKTGNNDLKNEKNLKTSINFMYKKFVFGVQSIIAYQYINIVPNIEMQPNGSPLFINKPTNFSKPMYLTGIFAAYSNKIDFWSFNVSIFSAYSYANAPTYDNNYETVKGFYGVFNLKNNFVLPNNFSIYLGGSYTTKQPQAYVYQDPSYAIDLNIEKRFFKDQFRLAIETKFSNKYTVYDYNLLGVNYYSKRASGWSKSIGLVASWRFNNHKKVQQAKDNEYLKML